MSNKKPKNIGTKSNTKGVKGVNSVGEALNFFMSIDNQLSESEKPKGLKDTEKVQKASGKVNDEHIKISEKNAEQKIDGNDTSDNRYVNSDKSQEIHDELETLNGMEMLEYDIEPSDSFKERAKNAIAGKSPSGELPGNAVESDFAKDFEKRIKASKKKRDDAKLNYVAMGKDMELLPNSNNKGKANAFEGYTHYAVNNGRILKGYSLDSQNLNESIKSVVLPDLRKSFAGLNLKETKIHTLAGLGRLGLSLKENFEGFGDDYVDGDNEVDFSENDIINESISNEYDGETLFAFFISKDERFAALNMSVLGSWSFDLTEYADYSRKELADITYPDMADWYPREDLLATIPDLKINKSNFKLMTRSEVMKAGIAVDASNTFNAKLNAVENQEGGLMENVKTLKFKQKFASTRQAMSLIPESFKVNGTRFKMSDGESKYLVEWKGNSIVGSASILEEKNPKLVAENISKIKHLMAFNTLNEGTRMTDSQIRAEEDMLMFDVTNKLRKIDEAKEAKEKMMISEAKKGKMVLEKFQVRNINLDSITKKYATVKNANYIKEGVNYIGVNYNVVIKDSSLSKKDLMEQIRRDNLSVVPFGRKVKFTFTNENGDLI